MSDTTSGMCAWPRNGILMMDVPCPRYAEYMMGQMEYPNRTADPEEQSYKASRL